MIRVFIVMFLSLALAWADLKSELIKASPSATRDGCPNAARKLLAGELLTVVFLGGSITESRAGFSSTVPEWLRKKYPTAKIEAVNAGWAGTDSELGAQRLDAEVLARKPDLVFVEFAVNDIAKPGFAHMERIVRKLWTANAEIDVVFLYTITKGDLEFYRKGWFPLSVSRHEVAAQHYAVPMIAVGQTVATEFLGGRLQWEDFSNDTCHPHAKGYTHYTAAITSALEVFFSAGKPGPHPLPPPLTPDFILNPPPIPAVPLAEAAPMRADDGRETSRVFALPQPATHWVAEPEYRLGDRPLWRLYWQPLPRTPSLDATAGLSRAAWKNNVAWLEEPGFFTGPSLRWIAGGRKERAGCFGANGTESFVLTFIAPQAGDYLLELNIEGISGYSQKEKAIGLNVVQIRKNATVGTSALFVQSTRADMQPLTRRATSSLAEGDEVAFVFLPHQVGGGAFFTGFNARFGLLRSTR